MFPQSRHSVSGFPLLTVDDCSCKHVVILASRFRNLVVLFLLHCSVLITSAYSCLEGRGTCQVVHMRRKARKVFKCQSVSRWHQSRVLKTTLTSADFPISAKSSCLSSAVVLKC